MARGVPKYPSDQGIPEASTSSCFLEPEDPQSYMRKWYFTRQEIEEGSPSRRDGISLKKESHLRSLYCSFLQAIGKKLKVSQTTIACAMMLCHRFYMRQSHAKNDWQVKVSVNKVVWNFDDIPNTVATASFFLSCKIREPPRFLKDVVVVAYEMVHKSDSSALQSIRHREVLNKQKELIEVGERLILSTIGFDLDIQLPYTSLAAALRSLNILPNLAQMALNFVNDCLCTPLCLQYKPHYIAAGSVALAAKIHKVKLPTQEGKVWWLEFDVSPKQLNEVIQRMMGPDRKQPQPPDKAITSETLSRKPSGLDDDGGAETKPIKEELDDDQNSRGKIDSIHSICRKQALPPEKSITSETVSRKPTGTDEDGRAVTKPIKEELDDQSSRGEIDSVYSTSNKIDIDRIRDAIKRRRCERVVQKKLVRPIDDEKDTEAWIESELENGIELENTSPKKIQRL